MTDDEREDLLSSTITHDMMLQFLMANMIQLFPAHKRREFVNAVLTMEDLPVPEGMATNIDGADRLAGISQKVKAHMQRIAIEAAKQAGM